MNKVITDGLELMPPSFSDGLDVWSSGDGTPGSDTYAGSGTGAFVPADQDFGPALEVVKTENVTRVRYMGETTILPGCYLQVTARVKCLSGALPDVRIAGWAGQAGGSHLDGVIEVGPSVSLTSYGEVVEISAIIGTGQRNGVDMVWADANYGHIGLDLTGSNGGVVRIDDFEIVDITGAFLRDMLGIVDVRDYGALGDGVTDDSAAFEAADADANGREVLVTEGTYFLGGNVTFDNQIRFEGTITMEDEHRLVLQKNYDFPTYVDAFGDEELAFKKAFQALLNFSDHESLDLGGRRISVTEPIDMQAAVSNRTTSAVRRVIRNGQFKPVSGSVWDDDVAVSQATYNTNNRLVLTNVTNIGAIQVGSLVTGNGVGREIYVHRVDVASNEIVLSNPLFDAEGTQEYTFTRFKYLLDFSGFDQLSELIFDQIDFDTAGDCSGILMPPAGSLMQIHDCRFTRPKDRGLTSHGTACQGLIIDRCNFVSDEAGIPTQNRKSLCFNANKNDVKVRNNRSARFRHFAVLSGFIFVCIDVQVSYRCLVAKPYGPGHFINGLNVQGNLFRNFGDVYERVEDVDTTFADFDYSNMRNIIFEGNSFSGIEYETQNPVIREHEQSSEATTWTIETDRYLPFGGKAMTVDAVVPVGAIRNDDNDAVFALPYAVPEQGSDEDEFHLVWPEPVRGKVKYSVRMDRPS